MFGQSIHGVLYWPNFINVKSNDEFWLEPVGSKAPTFAIDFVTMAVKSRENESLALTCQAQAYPVPIFKYVLKIKYDYVFNVFEFMGTLSLIWFFVGVILRIFGCNFVN